MAFKTGMHGVAICGHSYVRVKLPVLCCLTVTVKLHNGTHVI